MPETNTSRPMPKAPTTPEERRVRRMERRAKQRLLNGSRALAMRAARLAQENLLVTPEALPSLNVGCSGWFYWHWRGLFYPQEMATSKWFSHYANTFNTVELNAPFYSWPTVNAVKGWLRQAAGTDFVFTVKVCELITHVKRFSRTQLLVQDFGYIADLLGERMGCFLFQLPPSYDYSAARLKTLVSQLDPARRNVVEFRHPSWWRERVYTAFRESGIIFCSCSAPNLPDELVITAEEIYIRFHGKTQWYRHDYDAAEIAVWCRRIQNSGAQRIWAYFNNDRDACAIKNALELEKQLTEPKAVSLLVCE